MIVLSAIADVFTELFTGTGSWLGLLLLLTFIIGLSMMVKYGGLLTLPISVFLAMYYFNAALGWHGLIMMLTAIFVLGNTVIKSKGGD